MQPVLSRWSVLDRLMEAGAEQRAGTRWFDAEGAHIVTVPVPQRDDCAGAFLFLNHENIGDVLLATAEEAGVVNITSLSDWSLTRVMENWRVDWQADNQSASATCTLLVAADGTASTVRSRLEIGLDRYRYQYLIAVLYGRQQGVSHERTLDVYLAEQRMVSLIPRLSENHAAGLQMGTITGGGFVALKKQLQLAAGDERVLGGMALKAAGLMV